MSKSLRGSGRALILYDVCEAIDLEALRAVFGARRTGPTFKHAAPEYVQFQRPPVIEPLDQVCFDSGEQFDAQIKYYDYGVVSIIFELPFSGEWEDLVHRASRWMVSGEFERRASQIARQKLDRAGDALSKRYPNWLAEDYFIFHLTNIPDTLSASTLLSSCGDDIARIVRGETERLADAERNEVLQSSLSYYPNDVTVIGWNAAFLHDTITGAQTAIDLLEYSNSQLLEFRHYDELLTRELASVYASLDRGSGLMQRWRLAREAARLQTVALDVTELAERADNAVKFLSDMFAARLYRMAATKVGVIDYKNLVNQKLRTADHLYGFMIQQFQQSRAFVLELMVVVILVIELVFFFRGQF